MPYLLNHYRAAWRGGSLPLIVEHRGEIEISDLAPMNASYTIDGHTFEAFVTASVAGIRSGAGGPAYSASKAGVKIGRAHV